MLDFQFNFMLFTLYVIFMYIDLVKLL